MAGFSLMTETLERNRVLGSEKGKFWKDNTT